MWLVYLRFQDEAQVHTYHVRTGSKDGVKTIMDLAEQRGLNLGARLVEYAAFYAHATIKPKEVPNFHFYDHHEWVERWKQAEAAKG